ncbi:efflux RND transporter periplasmic adaptor subunit [Marichromatium bheemlicum]|uniref:Efflux RND transporter periplasmic adaptor subunit n=1 Tax=Marichromatium bheemlicum TaxID=365339 RepID=A0ABX1IA55_9GAMM|nr:efflux RND transporter periplasmic adaptor subunit [Marichromatium bheemlicum]NKN34133.1 efflux RND transporter periplasmic adaptor subunit [Marichromatium bheemlicum]
MMPRSFFNGVLLLLPALAGAEAVLSVTTVELGTVLVHPVREAPAEAVALNDTRLGAEINGVIAAIDVAVGDRVERGQVLARLDCTPHEIKVARAQAALAAGRATLEFSELQLDNARRLSARRSISQEELDKREADARTRKAELDRLQAALDAAEYTASKCTIVAPLNAVVIERIASVGDYAVPGTEILRLLDDENIEVSAKVQEQDLGGLEAAAEVRFVGRLRDHPVRLRTVLPLLERRLRTYEVRLRFVAEPAPPGAAGRLRWRVGGGRIPADLLVRRDGGFGVFVLEDGRARFQSLPEARAGHPAATSLAPTTRLIVDGRFRVEDGEAVRAD